MKLDKDSRVLPHQQPNRTWLRPRSSRGSNRTTEPSGAATVGEVTSQDIAG